MVRFVRCPPEANFQCRGTSGKRENGNIHDSTTMHRQVMRATAHTGTASVYDLVQFRLLDSHQKTLP